MSKIISIFIVFFLGLSTTGLAEQLKGPMSDREFFEKIDLTLPELQEVNVAVQAEDFDSAKRLLAHYYRNRKGQFFTLEPQIPGEGAEKWQELIPSTRLLVERTGAYDQSLWEGDFFDWNGAELRYKERMYFFSSIAKAYAASGDEAIAAAWVNLMRSFVLGCPKSEGGSMWYSMNVGIRMRSGWPDAFHCFVKSPSFTDEDMILFLKSVWQQSDFIRYNHDPTSNWLTFAMAGLYTSGAMYPEFIDALSWRRYACETAVEDMDIGWLPDGMSIELSPGYGQFFSNYYVIYDLAKHVGRLTEFGLPEFFLKTEKPYEVYMNIMAPDRTTPATNDNGPQNVVTILKRALERFPAREDFQWIVTDGQEGRKPDFTSIVLPYAGFAAMRSGWATDDNMLYFDFGPVGYRHAHQDKLEVILWAYGRQILFDPGRIIYEENRYNNYCLDTFCHNTALVDNRPQRRIWYKAPHPDNSPYKQLSDFNWKSTDEYDYASGIYDDAYGIAGESDAYPYKEGGNFKEGWTAPAVHHRRVLFIKPDVFLIADTLVAQDDQPHEYEVRWHLDSVETQLSEDGTSVRTTDTGVPNLELVALLDEGLKTNMVSAQDEPQILGWKVVGTPVPATTVQHIKSGPDTIQFLTLLLPLKAGQSDLLEKVRPLGDQMWEIGLKDGRDLKVLVPEDSAEPLSCFPVQ